MLPRYYKRNGEPYEGKNPWKEWALDFEKGNRHVALDELPNGVEISTIWLGLDHGFGSRRPKIFESMVFAPKSRDQIGECWRYSTEEEALRGHKMLKKKWEKFKSIEQVMHSLGD